MSPSSGHHAPPPPEQNYGYPYTPQETSTKKSSRSVPILVSGLVGLVLGVGGTGEGYFWADELFVSTADSVAAGGVLTGRHHLAFQARDAAMVDAFHRAALASGGTDNGGPGPRPYHPGYYAAFVLDPDGNNIEAVYHGEAKRSAASVKINF